MRNLEFPITRDFEVFIPIKFEGYCE
jgi:hypothetical protein